MATSPRGIRLEGVEVAFASRDVALRNFDALIHPGEFIAVVGPSGCGKSTLLRLVAGLQSVSRGRLEFIQQAPTSDGASERTGLVFQQPNLLPWRRVLDNISLPLELRRVPRASRLRAADGVRRMVGLEAADLAKLPGMLSGGMQMRVSLARALVNEPDVMLLDEPFGALDDILRGQLNEELAALWQKQGWTTIFVTHNVSEAVLMSQRVLVMTRSPGRVHTEVVIPLAYPRSLELRGTPEFARLVGSVGRALREAAS